MRQPEPRDFHFLIRPRCHKNNAVPLEHRGDVGRFVFPGQLPHHSIEDIDRFGGKPRAGPHGRRAAPRARMVRAEDKAEGIDQE
jgi:hypothetical protein